MNRPRTILGTALAAVTCGLLASCAGSLDTWPVDPLIKVFPDDPAGTNQADGDTWRIARNGHATVQIVVRSAVDIAELSVDVEPPLNGKAALEVAARWVDYVPVGSNPPQTPREEVARPAPALFPDPLREDFPFPLPAGRTQPIWITVYCPPDADPGDYDGRVNLLAGEDRLASSEFTVRVVSATVPAEQTLRVTNWLNLDIANLRRFHEVEEDSEEYWELLENIGRVMAGHKQNVLITPVSSLVRPSIESGRLRYDFSRFDRWVETFQRAGLIGTIEGGHLLARRSGYHSPVSIPAWVVEGTEVVRATLSPDDPRAERYLRSFLPALHTHLKENSWADRYIQHVLDEPHDREAPIYNRYARIVHECLPGVRTIDAVSLDQDISFFADVCDIWVPVLGSFDHHLGAIEEHVEKGGQAWFYTCIFPQGRYLNRFIDYSPLKVRLLHWFNFRHNFTGFLHWGGNYWGPKPFENVQTVINSNRTLLPAGDNAIVYPNPSKNSVLSSIRLEAMRDGIEDFELLTALARQDPDVARELAETLIPHVNDYVRDPAVFRTVHRRLLEVLQ
ncbi:MAG: DUF4091 domain-containing protein [bacterium]|nr:DUF4091 domain-containing protein [bacterium]